MVSFNQTASRVLIKTTWKATEKCTISEFQWTFSEHSVDIMLCSIWLKKCFHLVPNSEIFIVWFLVILKYPRWFCIEFDAGFCFVDRVLVHIKNRDYNTCWKGWSFFLPKLILCRINQIFCQAILLKAKKKSSCVYVFTYSMYWLEKYLSLPTRYYPTPMRGNGSFNTTAYR